MTPDRWADLPLPRRVPLAAGALIALAGVGVAGLFLLASGSPSGGVPALTTMTEAPLSTTTTAPTRLEVVEPPVTDPSTTTTAVEEPVPDSHAQAGRATPTTNAERPAATIRSRAGTTTTTAPAPNSGTSPPNHRTVRDDGAADDGATHHLSSADDRRRRVPVALSGRGRRGYCRGSPRPDVRSP